MKNGKAPHTGAEGNDESSRAGAGKLACSKESSGFSGSGEPGVTLDVKFNGLEELREMMKEAKRFVQTLKEAKELIEYLSRKCGYDVKGIAGRLAYDLENASREIWDEIQKIEGGKGEQGNSDGTA